VCHLATALAATPDLARERRWADEVVPQLFAGEPVWLATAHQPKVLALYAQPAKRTQDAIIVVHGLGVHPDWNLIGVLRSDLAELGFATLSVQMPVLAADAPRDDYRSLFPYALERLDAALQWLRAHGYARIGVVSHSLGAAMVNVWLATSHPAIDAWVPVGLTVDFEAPPRVPVQDVVAERDFPEALAFAKTRAPELPKDACSSSLAFAGTDHYFANAAHDLATRIAPFLARALAGKC
jgi:predicted alpha/beta-fold hydrolase